VCCRADSGAPKNAEDAAGYWGSVGYCEIPYRTIESALEYIATEVRPDIVLWMGDNVHGLMHSQTQAGQLEALANLTAMFQKAFARPGPNGHLPIILPILGNHEGYPTDTFNYRNITSEAWLLHTTAKLWQPFLTPAAIEQYNRTGYYTQLLPRVPGLRVIALNCLLYGDNNLYTMINSTDPLGHIAWINETLANAEAASEKVIVIAHVPTCCEKGTEGWPINNALRFYRKADGAAGTLCEHHSRGLFGTLPSRLIPSPPQLQGRTALRSGVHRPLDDHVRIASYKFGSHEGVHPGFNVFELDARSYQVLSMQKHNLDLELSNREKKAIWKFSYDMHSQYHLATISPEALYAVSTQLLVRRLIRT
jgi:hypothetical protein